MVDSGKVAQKIKRVLTGSGFAIEMENAEGRKEMDERKARRFYERKGKFMVAYDVGDTIRFHRGKDATLEELEGIRKSCQKIANKHSLDWEFRKFNQRIHPKRYRDEPVKHKNDSKLKEMDMRDLINIVENAARLAETADTEKAMASLSQLTKLEPRIEQDTPHFADPDQAKLFAVTNLIKRIPDEFDDLSFVLNGIMDRRMGGGAVSKEETALLSNFLKRMEALGELNSVPASGTQSMVDRVRAAFANEKFAHHVYSTQKGILSDGTDPTAKIIKACLPLIERIAKDQVLLRAFEQIVAKFERGERPTEDEYDAIEEFMSLSDKPEHAIKPEIGEEMMRRAKTAVFDTSDVETIPDSVLQFENREKEVLWKLRGVVERVKDEVLRGALQDILEKAEKSGEMEPKEMELVLEVVDRAKNGAKAALKQTNPISEARDWIDQSLGRAVDGNTIVKNTKENETMENHLDVDKFLDTHMGSLPGQDPEFDPDKFVDSHPDAFTGELSDDDIEAMKMIGTDELGNPVKAPEPEDEEELFNSLMRDLDKHVEESLPPVSEDAHDLMQGDIVSLKTDPNTSVAVFQGIGKDGAAFVTPTDNMSGWDNLMKLLARENKGTANGKPVAKVDPAIITRFEIGTTESTDPAKMNGGYSLEKQVSEDAGGTVHILKDKNGNETGLQIVETDAGVELRSSKKAVKLGSFQEAVTHLNNRIDEFQHTFGNEEPEGWAIEPPNIEDVVYPGDEIADASNPSKPLAKVSDVRLDTETDTSGSWIVAYDPYPAAEYADEADWMTIDNEVKLHFADGKFTGDIPFVKAQPMESAEDKNPPVAETKKTGDKPVMESKNHGAEDVNSVLGRIKELSNYGMSKNIW